MLEMTLERLEGFIPPSNRVIITHRDQAESTMKIVEGQCAEVISEPAAMQTTSALALGAFVVDDLHKRYTENSSNLPIMISLHADHVIENIETFKAALCDALVLAEKDKLCLIGVKPSRPDIGFGYIEKGDAIPETRGFSVTSFREKPDLRTAKSYVSNGSFFWNSGLFIWKTQKLVEEIKRYLPRTITELENARDQLGPLVSSSAEDLSPFYSKLQKIAIDHAVLEVSENVVMVEADIGWQDVGTWSALDHAFEADENGNLIFTDSIAIDCKNTTIDGDGPLVAALGLHDLIVVSMKDATLVAPKERAHDVKLFVEKLIAAKREDLY